MIRRATSEDVQKLCWMARRFIEESKLPFTYDYSVSFNTFTHYINDGCCIILVDEDEGDLCGGIMGSVDRDFCHETVAYITKMYVEQEFRGLGSARGLVESFETEAKCLGASIVFASATAGMGDRVEKLFVRLFEKYGFEKLGRVVMKEI